PAGRLRDRSGPGGAHAHALCSRHHRALVAGLALRPDRASEGAHRRFKMQLRLDRDHRDHQPWQWREGGLTMDSFSVVGGPLDTTNVAWTVLSATGEEALSSLFSFTLTLAAKREE